MKQSQPKIKTPAEGLLELREIQRQFATGIMRPLTAEDRMQSKWIDGTSTKKAAAAFIMPNDRLSSYERIEIYNKQYWYRLLDSLYEDFPALRSMIGDERFHRMSTAYLEKYPSRSFTLRDLGYRMERFLKAEPKWIESNPRLAMDVTRLEWAHIVAFDGEEFPPLTVDALLDGGDPNSLRLGIQPYITFLACDYPVDDYLLAVRRREEPRGEASNAVAERVVRRQTRAIKLPKEEKAFIAVHRVNNSVFYKRLEPEAYRICVALQKGLPLQVACERALLDADADINFGAKLREWFTLWASFGWFCKVGSNGKSKI